MNLFRARDMGLIALCTLSLCAFVTAENISDNVVGMYNLSIQSGQSYITFPYQKAPVATGVVSANAGDVVTAITDSWKWDTSFQEPGESTFYLELTSGAFEGWHFYIATIDGDLLTLIDAKAADLAENELAGSSFKVVPANRVRDLFGEPGRALLAGGTSPRKADTVTRWAGIAWDAPIYVSSIDDVASGRIPGHWYQNGAIADDVVIDRDEAVCVNIRGESPVQLRIIGDVSKNSHAMVLEAGLHLIGGAACTSEALGTSGLTDIVSSSAATQDADSLFAWDQGWSAPLFRSSTDGKWYQGENEADGFQIKPATGYMLLLRQPPVENVWVRQSPLMQ